MRRLTIAAALAAAVSTAACGGSPLAPSATTVQPTWVLAGQSNALGLQPALSRYATLITSSQSGTPISAWATDGSLWPSLSAALIPDVSRLVWFQGESDADVGVTPGAPQTTAYVERLRDLVMRVRARTRPTLFVVVCGLTNSPGNRTSFDAIRSELQRFAATDSNAIYISTLDLPSDNSQHLTDAGYISLAARIAAVAVPRISFSR